MGIEPTVALHSPLCHDGLKRLHSQKANILHQKDSLSNHSNNEIARKDELI